MRFINQDDFRNSKMRGFNFSVVPDDNTLTIKNIAKARAAGANHIRYWLQINHDPGSYTYWFCNYKGVKIASPLPTLDKAIAQAKAAGIYIILTLEIFPKQGKDDWWGDAKRKTAIQAFWRDQLARKYKDEMIIAAYDLMNEPRINADYMTAKKLTEQQMFDEYWAFARNQVSVIKQVDQNHCMIIEVLKNQMLNHVSPLPYANLVYSPHGYTYQDLTHQGVNSTTRYKYPSTKFPEGYFPNSSYWTAMRDFAAKAPVWVGEFACINWAPLNDKGEYTSTAWFRSAIEFMEKYGISWAAHAWREYQGWDLEIPSSWYEGKSFSNAKPTSLPPSSARTDNSPTMQVLKSYFAKNTYIQ